MDAGNKLKAIQYDFDIETETLLRESKEVVRSGEVINYLLTSEEVFVRHSSYVEKYVVAAGILSELFLRIDGTDGSYLHVSLATLDDFSQNTELAEGEKVVAPPSLVIQERDIDNRLIQMYGYVWDTGIKTVRRQYFSPELIALISDETPAYSVIRLEQNRNGEDPMKSIQENTALASLFDNLLLEIEMGLNGLAVQGKEVENLAVLIGNAQPVHSSLVY